MLDDVIHVTGTGASSLEKKAFPARFHGAFTGGFSAGFHNSVGSAEGWTPSTFTSSRANRAEKKERRAEDLMDSEDLNEAAQAGTTMRTTAQFQGASTNRAGDALGRMITPVSESIGVKMLMRMGWRHGHGVGARKSKPKPPVEKIVKKVYTVQMPPGREAEAKASAADEESDEAVSGDDEEAIAAAKSALRVLGEAPAEVALHHKIQKADVYGIGFDPKRHGGQIDRGVSGSQSARMDAIKKRQVLMGGRDTRASLGFGLSALEESGAYDDAYSAPDMEQYDLEEHDAEEERQSSKRERKLQAQQQFHEVFEFVPAKRPPVVEQAYPPIEVPASFNEVHRAAVDDLKIGGLSLSEDVRALAASLYEASNLAMTPDHRIVRLSGVAASTRGAILGARQLKAGPVPPPTVATTNANGKSVFEGVSVSDKQRLAESLMGNFAMSSEGAETYNADWQSQLEAKGATLFPGDLDKQKRFGLFLGFYRKKMLGDAAGAFFDVVKSAKAMGSSSTSQLLREQEEFNTLVKKHEPKGFKGSGQMVSAAPSDPFADRFASGGVIAPSSVSGFDTLMTTISGPALQSARAAAGESKDISTAANLEMFGKMTRTRSEWRPAPLLCRRFGIRDPFEGKEDAKKAQSKSDVALESLRATVMSSFQTPNPTPWFAAASEIPNSQQAAEAAVAGLLFDDNEVTADLPEGVEEVKPSVDLYRAIFQDDDEEEEEAPAADLQIDPTPTAEMKANPGPPPGFPPGSQAEQQAFEEQTRVQIQMAREKAASLTQQLAAEKSVHPSRLAQMAPVLKLQTPPVSAIQSVNKHAIAQEPVKKEERRERSERRNKSRSSSRRRSKRESRSRSRKKRSRSSSRDGKKRSRSRSRKTSENSKRRSRDRDRSKSTSRSRSRRRRDKRSRSRRRREDKRSKSRERNEEKSTQNNVQAEEASDMTLALAPAADKLSLKRLEQMTQEKEEQEAILEQARIAALKSIHTRPSNDMNKDTAAENTSLSKPHFASASNSSSSSSFTTASFPSSRTFIPPTRSQPFATVTKEELRDVVVKIEPADEDESAAHSMRTKKAKNGLPASSLGDEEEEEDFPQVLDKSIFKVKPKSEQTIEVLSSEEEAEEIKSSNKENKKKKNKDKEAKKKKDKKKKVTKSKGEELEKNSKKKKEKKQSRNKSDSEEEEEAESSKATKKKKKKKSKKESESDSEEATGIDQKLEISKQLLDKLKATLAKQKEKKHKKKSKNKDQDPDRKTKHKR